jgi:hypothetical protein
VTDSDFPMSHPADDDESAQGSTGDERVDAAMARLAGLNELPLAAQVTVFDDVHRLLQDALTGSDQVGTEANDR